MKTEPLEDVLHAHLFRVADYQRPYAWERKQLLDLWDDIDLAGSADHYTGTLVLQRTGETATSESGKRLEIVDVVDGQQRLTTCIILLDRIRRALRALEHRSAGSAAGLAAEELERIIWVNVSGARVPRLSVGSSTDSLFQRSVLADAALTESALNAGQRRLIGAAAFFDERIGELAAEDVAETLRRLLELRSRVSFRLVFLVYMVESAAEVGVLFETLNERGTALSELEKVKNYLLYLARQIDGRRSAVLAGSINTAWSEIFENLAKRNLDEGALLRSHWLATQNPQPREWRRVGSIKARFPRSQYVATSGRLRGAASEPAVVDENNDDRLISDVSSYVEELRQCSAFLRDLHDDSAQYTSFGSAAPAVRQQSAALLRSGVLSPFRPVLFASRLRYPNDGDFYGRLLSACEIYSARVFAIAQSRANAGESALARAGFDLYSGAPREQVLDSILAKAWQFAPDEVVRSNFDPSIAWYWRRSHKYVLYEYERSLSRASADLRPLSEFGSAGSKTTEHVLPQTPADDSDWLRDFSQDEHRALVHSIGNLVLTYDNAKYSNFEYARKRGSFERSDLISYSTSGLQGEQKIARDFERWTPEAIKARAGELAEWALSRWPIERHSPQQSAEDPFDDIDAIDDFEVAVDVPEGRLG